MFKILIALSLLTITNLSAYSTKDWEVYNACKEKVYDKKNNIYDYKACKEMLEHKEALKKYGAESSYKYWINRLYK